MTITSARFPTLNLHKIGRPIPVMVGAGFVSLGFAIVAHVIGFLIPRVSFAVILRPVARGADTLNHPEPLSATALHPRAASVRTVGP